MEAGRWASDTTELREGNAGLLARPRRLRRLANLRRLVRETRLTIDNLIYPLFVVHGGPKEEIVSMPGIYRWPVELLPA